LGSGWSVMAVLRCSEPRVLRTEIEAIQEENGLNPTFVVSGAAAADDAKHITMGDLKRRSVNP
ncbi:MAG: hypothetical protein SH818_17655, partial [Saprospiraceae bacterium]|nr:hypothetical protein [Saprospiraceae bacterium]